MSENPGMVWEFETASGLLFLEIWACPPDETFLKHEILYSWLMFANHCLDISFILAAHPSMTYRRLGHEV